MEFEILKKSHLKRNIIIGVLVVAIISAIILNFTRAKYRVTQSIPLVNGTINYSLADFNSLAIYIQSDNGYTQTDTIPESGYVLNEEESYCKVNDTRDDNISLSYDVNTKTLSVTPMTTKSTKCYLYFNEVILVKDTLLANYPTVLTRDDFWGLVTATTTGTIYKSLDETQYDNDGEVYYFAGNPTDNWVKFAGFYWRIIRINGDGTIRLIYNGTETNQNSSNTQIGTSKFNSNSNDNMYVGYMYTSGQVHGISTNSTIKGVLDNWYQNNLATQSSKLSENAGFCGDRNSYVDEGGTVSGGGTNYIDTYYGPYIRVFVGNPRNPSFKCTDSQDLYTIRESNKGNKVLTYPIGLITADEVSYAGSIYSSAVIGNTSSFLYSSSQYWTMSPLEYYSSYAYAYVAIVSNGGLGMNNVSSYSNGVRPVINLRADVKLSGSGTAADPYIVL